MVMAGGLRRTLLNSPMGFTAFSALKLISYSVSDKQQHLSYTKYLNFCLVVDERVKKSHSLTMKKDHICDVVTQYHNNINYPFRPVLHKLLDSNAPIIKHNIQRLPDTGN